MSTGKRSKPVRSAKAALTRFGSVLWGDDDFFNARSLQVLITRLRHRFSKDPRIQILNVRGVGYKLFAE